MDYSGFPGNGLQMPPWSDQQLETYYKQNQQNQQQQQPAQAHDAIAFDDNDNMPSSSASLQDYIVHKPPGRKTRSSKPVMLPDQVGINHKASPAQADAVDQTDAAEPLSSAGPPAQQHLNSNDLASSLVQHRSTPSLNSGVPDGNPVYDYPRVKHSLRKNRRRAPHVNRPQKDVYGEDGSFRFNSVHDGGIIVLQWSSAGMTWRDLGKIAAPKVQAFLSAMESIKLGNTGHDGVTDRFRYIRGVQGLINQIREGATSPELRRHAMSSVSDMSAERARVNTAIADHAAPLKLSSAMEQAAAQTSEDRRRLAQERGQLRRPDQIAAQAAQPGLPGVTGLNYKHTELARRTGTIETLQKTINVAGPASLQRVSSQTPTDVGKRTVLHDPYQQTDKAAGNLTDEHNHVPSPWARVDKAGQLGQPVARTWPPSPWDVPSQPPAPELPSHASAMQPFRLTDDELRRMHPLRPHWQGYGNYSNAIAVNSARALAKNGVDQYLKDLQTQWSSGLRTGRMVEDATSDMIAQVPAISSDPRKVDVARALMPLYARLSEYAVSQSQGYAGPDKYFTPFAPAAPTTTETEESGEEQESAEDKEQA